MSLKIPFKLLPRLTELNFMVLTIQILTFPSQVLNEKERTRLVQNIAGHLKDAQEFIQKRAVANFAQADPEYGSRIQDLLDEYRLKAKVSTLT